MLGGLKNTITSAYLLADPRKKQLALATRQLNDSDVVIRVPRIAPDSADSVVVVEVESEIQTNPVRLLASHDQPNVLLSFDGELHGSGLRFGDGKSFRAYVFQWRDPKEWIGWQVRVNAPTEYEVALKYTTGSKDSRGSYEVAIGNQVLRSTVVPTANENESTTVSLGRVKLAPGKHEIAVRPAEIKGGELMRLFYVSFTPVGSQ